MSPRRIGVKSVDRITPLIPSSFCATSVSSSLEASRKGDNNSLMKSAALVTLLATAALASAKSGAASGFAAQSATTAANSCSPSPRSIIPSSSSYSVSASAEYCTPLEAEPAASELRLPLGVPSGSTAATGRETSNLRERRQCSGMVACGAPKPTKTVVQPARDTAPSARNTQPQSRGPADSCFGHLRRRSMLPLSLLPLVSI
mmetsp:Transcript_41389/g.74953  ORF Transcript_41389/g.74953 Transcript_41389/m.74953 type:complete len:203 (-) Transcript_41389:4-612(-)